MPPTPAPPPAPPTPYTKIDVIGYYGNSGNALSYIPRITEVPCYYNVIIITFANFNSAGDLVFEIQGPYENNLQQMKNDIKQWKSGTDPYGRKRLALFSIGGQNGIWPDNLSEEQVENEITAFIAEYELDGFDVDLEGHAVSEAETLTQCITNMMAKGYTVAAAPEAAQGPLNAYQGILPLLSWVHPQFYNNGPNAVTTPWTPEYTCWESPPNDWQDPSPDCYVTAGTPWWVAVLQTITTHLGMNASTQGMLMPTTTAAAGNNNDWDINLLKEQVASYGITHVGTWAIAYDNTIDYAFSKAMASIMDPAVVCSEPSPTGAPTPTPPNPVQPTPVPAPTPDSDGDGSLSWFTQEDFDAFFPNINNNACTGKNFFTYDALMEAAKAYPTFASSGDLEVDKRELAAFLGQTSHETTGGWSTAPGGPQAWGYCFKEEVGCESGTCTQYCDGSNTEYPCMPGQTYQGRGPMQLSWNYNYGQFSQDFFGDKGKLLSEPGLVASDAVISYEAGMWFWMTPQSPKPSCHDVITGNWAPSADDLNKGRVPGYGMTTNIINGGLECNMPTNSKVEDRVAFYRRFAGILGVSVDESTLYCDSMTSYR